MIVFLVIRIEHYFKIFLGAKKKNFNRDRGIVHFLLQLTYQMGTVAYYVESDDLTHFQQPFFENVAFITNATISLFKSRK